ncbi:MAG: alkaline phosphatase [Chitinophagaceae bacterium]|nr:alkaline phosphatase [Chitinophagaceae bacterium]
MLQKILFLIFVLLKTPVYSQDSKVYKGTRPKNIILMIGDGMGLTQITAGLIRNNYRLHLERCKSLGLIKTWSSDALITDSAAGATAFSCGEKTYNGAIGVGKDSLRRETILEKAGNNKLSTGLVVTASITHATPASFYAHQKLRSLEESIAQDMLNAPLTHFVGGGYKFFKDRTDKRDITKILEQSGFTITQDESSFKNAKGKAGWFIADGQPLSLLKGRDDVFLRGIDAIIPKLAANSNGFFLMIEGSQIDWGGHENNSDYIISEMIEFDKGIGKVLDFAEKNKETLVIITADHETGGYALNTDKKDAFNFTPQFTTDKHTCDLIPVFAFGVGAEVFQGIYDNTDIYHKIKYLYGF